jgi:cell pole-organizing protein PopZ
MEEILASIRRIISEDDGPHAEAEAAPPPVAAAPEPEPEPEPAPPEPVAEAAPPPLAPEPEPEEDVLELTQRVEPPPETVGDLELVKPEPAPLAKLARDDDDGLVSLPSAFAAASAFGQLSAAVAMPAAGHTLEDVVRELLRPLLKAWLDENLPRIVEAKVAEEVERISRTRVR